MDIRISQHLNDILEYAREEALRTGSGVITIDHLVLGILRDADNDACRTLEALGIGRDEFKRFIDDSIGTGSYIPYSEGTRVAIGRGAGNAVNLAAFEALKANQTEILPAHLLLAASRMDGWAGLALMKSKGISTTDLEKYLKEHGMTVNTVKTVTPSPEEVTHLIRITNFSPKILS